VVEIVDDNISELFFVKYFMKFNKLIFFLTNDLSLKVESKILFIDYFLYKIFIKKQIEENIF
jgi:hypothetical protein